MRVVADSGGSKTPMSVLSACQEIHRLFGRSSLGNALFIDNTHHMPDPFWAEQP
jgi:hypothetical protein